MDRGIREVGVAFVATRLPLFLLVWLATYLIPPGGPAQPGNLHYLRGAPRPLQAWVQWDAEWYLLIADHGYGALGERPELAPRNQPEDTSGFFPLYPLAAGAAGRLAGSGTATLAMALLLSNASLLGLGIVLHRWVEADHGEEAARGACAALFLFPTSLFLSAPYPESTFLLLAVSAMAAGARGRHGLAAVLAAGAALARPVGVLLALPLAAGALARGAAPARRRGALLAAAGAPIGLAGYAVFCQAQFGDPLAFVARQVRWRGPIGPPWTFLTEFLAEPRPHGRSGSVVDFTVAAAVVLLLPALFRRLGPACGLYAAAAALLPLSSGLFAFSRLALGIFPLFVLLGLWWAESRTFRLAYAALCLPFAGLFAALYAAGWWVG